VIGHRVSTFAGVGVSIAFGYMCLAQAGPQTYRDWQKSVHPLVAERSDERSQVLVKARGAYFDQFAPLTPGGYYPVGSVGEHTDLPTEMSDTIVVAKFSDYVVHLSPSGRSVYEELIFTPSVVVEAGPGNVLPGHEISVLDGGGAVRKPSGEVVRSPIGPAGFDPVPGRTYVLFLNTLRSVEGYELFQTWDVTTGFALNNSSEDADTDQKHRSKNDGVPVAILIKRIQKKLGAR
jgi:hypothetical protein